MEFMKKMFSRQMFVSFVMGFSSGLPLLLTLSTMQAWLKDYNVTNTKIGLMALLGTPYTLKFLWAPIFDRFTISKLGRRKGWLLIIQICLAGVIMSIGQVNPAQNLTVFSIFALLITFFSASQDIVIDAYRREDLQDEELGLGSSLAVNGYRIGMLVAGGGALFMGDYMEWSMVYFTMGLCMLIGIITTIFTPEPDVAEGTPRNIKETIIEPLLDYFKRDGALMMLVFIFLYKVGDQMASTMSMPLYLDTGFSKSEVGAIVKLFGFWATIIGGLLGGSLMLKLGIFRSLVLFGFLQMISTAGFWLLHVVGKSNFLLTGVIAFENLSGGMGTAAYVAFMASLTNKKYTATQYALLSSLMGVPRVFAAAPTGWMTDQFGYGFFFIFCTLIAIPGLIILYKYVPRPKEV